MDLADPDPRPAHRTDRGSRLLVFDGEVAGIVVHPHMTEDEIALVAGGAFQKRTKEIHRLRAVSKEPERLGFKTEVEITTAFLPGSTRCDGRMNADSAGSLRACAAEVSGRMNSLNDPGRVLTLASMLRSTSSKSKRRLCRPAAPPSTSRERRPAPSPACRAAHRRENHDREDVGIRLVEPAAEGVPLLTFRGEFLSGRRTGFCAPMP